MNRRLVMIASILALAVPARGAIAQRTRLDDSLSPVQTYAVELAWGPGEITRALSALVAGTPHSMPPVMGRVINVEARLDTRDFVGRTVRIYLTLPFPQSAGGLPDLELRWEASNRFLAGVVRPGQSTLIFEGVIEEPVTSAVFDFVLALENGASGDPFVLEPIYEIEPLL